MTMFEWDISSYQRKFSHSLALCRLEGEETKKWRVIGSIFEDTNVVCDNDGEPFAQVRCECEDLAKKTTKYPVIEFSYAPIKCGFYHALTSESVIFSIWRKHVKSYKIGLSSEAYNIKCITASLMTLNASHANNIDMERPVTQNFLDFNVINSSMLLRGNSLEFFGESLAFIQENKIVLKDSAFKPLLTPYLGDKWQIVNL